MQYWKAVIDDMVRGIAGIAVTAATIAVIISIVVAPLMLIAAGQSGYAPDSLLVMLAVAVVGGAIFKLVSMYR